MKQFKGKAIYNPSGKAGEYSYWACNFYVGCSNGCEYCYCKNGILARALGGDTPTLKKCFKNEDHALITFLEELEENRIDLKKVGLFFSFTTDPMLPETLNLTFHAIQLCQGYQIPVKILTKRTDWIDFKLLRILNPSYISFGFTLTGHDELESGASTNQERIDAIRKLHNAGFKTWASIEPVIDFKSSLEMIYQTLGYCDQYNIGLESGKKYESKQINNFISKVLLIASPLPIQKHFPYIYFKNSLLKHAGIPREVLPKNCVTRDDNIFNK